MTKLPHFYAPLLAAGVLLGSLAHAAPDQHAAPARPADPIHRHDASAFVYVLEGSIVMQVQGGQEVTLTPGQTFYEGPEDVHTVGRNASKIQPARFLAVLIKKQGAPALIPTN